MEQNETFGSWLRRRRRAVDMTQEALADCAACSVVTIRKMESDERRPSRQLAGLLADCLQIPADERERCISFARQREDDRRPSPVGPGRGAVPLPEAPSPNPSPRAGDQRPRTTAAAS